MSSTQTPYEEDANPLTRNSGVYTDRLGNVFFSDENDPEEAVFGEQTEYIGVSAGAAADMLRTHGLYNADFRFGPPNPDVPIDDMNFLPSWRLVNEQGGGITARWVADTDARSGYVIEWTIDSAATDDRIYLEQVVEVSPHEEWFHAHARVTAPSSTELNADAFVSLQFYAPDGSASGAELVGLLTTLDALMTSPFRIGYDQDSTTELFAQIPTDARYVAVRFGVTATGAVTTTTSIPFLEIVAKQPPVTYATYTGLEVSFTGTGTTDMHASADNATGQPIIATDRFVAPAPGFVVGIGVRLSTNVTAGTLAVRARNATTTTSVGPTATLSLAQQERGAIAGIGTSQTYHFRQHDLLIVRATGDGFTPTTADGLAHVVVALFDAAT
jgi:hypothetical protein